MNQNEFESMLQAEKFQPPVPVQRDAGYKMGEHSHDFDACALIIAGEFTLVVNGIATSYRAGDIFRLPARTPHLESAGSGGASYLSGRRPTVAP